MIFTCDVESDFGGRTDGLQGIQEGLPYLLDLLRVSQIRGIFFLSTQYLDQYLDQAKAIQANGHLIGSHGDSHRSWRGKPWWQWRVDYLHSMTKIEKTFGLQRKQIPYRAPKFSATDRLHKYSYPTGHMSLLKHAWAHRPFQSVFYCHPFDLVESKSPPPTMFCRVWYSRPKQARAVLESLVCSKQFESVP